MRCPRDGSGLVKESHEGVVVDRCASCTGAWFDHGELARVAQHKELEVVAAIVPRGAPVSAFGCPRCAGDCVRTRVGDVETDACTSCRGVWLDGGELEAATAAVERGAAALGFRGFLARIGSLAQKR